MAAIVRTYECPECTERLGAPFRFDKFHMSRDEPPPECPGCQALAAKQVPAVFHMNERQSRKGYGTVSKAAEITQDIMEKDLGMTNFRDNMREGDQAVITPPHLQKQVDGFFSQSGPIIAAAKDGAMAAAREGTNPLSLMQKAAKSRGTDRVPISVVARR